MPKNLKQLRTGSLSSLLAEASGRAESAIFPKKERHPREIHIAQLWLRPPQARFEAPNPTIRALADMCYREQAAT
jgi:hypothetical protein